MALVYLLAMPGGWFGDRVWGPRKTVAIAGGVIMLGHLTLALPASGTFFVGLALVAIGSGLLKANISTMVGHLYDGPDDPRRDGGFTIFYMGINLGAFAAPLAIGTVGENVNWHLGFGLAARRHGAGPDPVPARHAATWPERSQRRPEAAVGRRSSRVIAAQGRCSGLHRRAVFYASSASPATSR